MESRERSTHHICVDCGRLFIDKYTEHRGYRDDVRQGCLKMYVNGMGFRAIERVKGVHHTTIIKWVKLVGELLVDADNPTVIPQVCELDELETFVGFKKTKSGSGQEFNTSKKEF